LFFIKFIFNLKENFKYLDMKKRQYRSNQGRNPEKESEMFKLVATGLFGILVCIIFLTLK